LLGPTICGLTAAFLFSVIAPTSAPSPFDPDHRILTPDTQKTLLRFLDHLDRKLFAIGDTQFLHRCLNR
jgi:hypothetical protein